jgi:small-conductance mechanosensitive channel
MMLLDLLAATATQLPFDIAEPSSRTRDVQAAVGASLTPAFLLVGIGSIMNVMMTRLTWIAGRIERLEDTATETDKKKRDAEFDWLCARRHLARRAIKMSSAAAMIISVVIAILFISTYLGIELGTTVAVLWVATVALLIAGLLYFVRETLLASDGPKQG